MSASTGSAGGEAFSYASENASGYFGGWPTYGGYNIAWTNQLVTTTRYWYELTASDVSCQNDDGHWSITHPFRKNFLIYRSVQSGTC